MAYVRLAIAGVILLAFTSLLAGMFYYKSNAASAENLRQIAQTKFDQAAAANEQQQAAIERITAVRKSDDEVLTKLSSAIETLQSQSEEVRTGIAALERGNNEVRAYLSGKLPVDLRRMLNRPRPVPSPN